MDRYGPKNLWLLASVIALRLLNIVHICPRGRDVHRPTVASTWPAPAKAICSFACQFTAMLMLFAGLALVLAAMFHDRVPELAALPLVLTAWPAILVIFYGLKRRGTLTVLPHWAAFPAITLIGVIGLF